MSNHGGSSLANNPLIVIIGVVAAIIAIVIFVTGRQSLPQFFEPTPTPIPIPTPTSTKALIYSNGTGTVFFEGVNVPPPKQNETGPFVFRNIDLEKGQDTSGTPGDIELSLNARTKDIFIKANRFVNIGAKPTNYEGCQKFLLSEQATEPNGQITPTDYVCVQTDEGRISLFHVLSVGTQAKGNDFVDITLKFDYTTWKKALDS